jgi:drug/metabolite transporter (DMT)-like permease
VKPDEKLALASTLRRAIVLAAAGEGFLALMDAFAKQQTVHYAVLQVSFLRFAAGSLFAAILFAADGLHWPSADAIRFNALRSLVGVGASMSFFTGLSYLPLAEATALSFAAPLILVLMGVVFLGERFSPRIGVALLAGFIGMLVIVGGQMNAATYTTDTLRGALAILASTVFYSLFLILLRLRANRDSVATLLLFQNLGPALVLAIPVAFVWHTPGFADALRFLALGILGVVGHSLMIKAFARAEAARLAPVHYLALLWGTLYGWLFFGNLPGIATLFGAVLVAAAAFIARKH